MIDEECYRRVTLERLGVPQRARCLESQVQRPPRGAVASCRREMG